MEHAMKMVLVPEENLLQLNAQNHRQPVFGGSEAHTQMDPSIASVLSRLDDEMKSILNSDTYKNEREKWTAYLTVLQRYLHFMDSERALQHHALMAKTESHNDETKKQSGHLMSLNDSVIIESVPQKFQNKAKLLLRRLRETPASTFSWDSAGVVSISGKPIKDSNIVDLVNDAMRARKVPKPAGRKAFARFLRAIQAPREFIGNEDLWMETRANSTLQSTPGDNNNNSSMSGDDDSLSDISQTSFYSGSDSAKSGRGVQSGAGRNSSNKKKRCLTWANLKL